MLSLPLPNFLSSRYQPYLVLTALCLIFFLPGLSTLPPTDRDESHFAQASRQMLETNDYIDIRFQDTPRHKKPIGIYWLQALTVGMTNGPASTAIWPYRVPSLVGASLAVFLTFHFGSVLFGRETAFLAAVLLCSSLLVNAEAHLAKTDAVLLACITAMQGALGQIYLRMRQGDAVRKGTVLLFWAACGLAILIKGPVAPAVVLLTVTALAWADRSLATLRLLWSGWGVLLMLIIVLPWFIAAAHATNGAFVRNAFASDLLPKLLGGHESHGAPPGYYLVLLPALFWPWSFFTIGALPMAWQSRADLGVRFALAWIAPVWLIFEIVPTKLPHYVLPIFPALALLTGHALTQAEGLPGFKKGLVRKLAWPGFILWLTVGLILSAGLIALIFLFHGRMGITSLLPTAGVGLICWSLWRNTKTDSPLRAVPGCVLGAFLVIGPAFHVILPGLEDIWLSRAIAREVQHYAPAPETVVAAVGYDEPSLVFLLGSQTRITNPAGAARTLADVAGSLALISSKHEPNFLTAAQATGLTPVVLATINGLNYTKGKKQTLVLYATERPKNGTAAPVSSAGAVSPGRQDHP